ncbi:MAG: SIMPL domain-containing protein [Microbacterium sp.]
MSEVIITVRGENEVRVAPELATVHLSVVQEGPERQTVVDAAMALAAPVRDGIASLQDAGSVAEWSSRRLDVSADRPWNNEGKRLAPVYRASIAFTATFRDISEMSLWATELSGRDGVEIGHTEWKLTPETTAEREREVATQAVDIAVSRATAYAHALGLQTVTPLEIADRGLISSSAPAPAGKAVRAAAFDMMAGAPTMQFQGEDIVISATVEARFSAS